MELTWSTFILEIINFLVLVWLLKHFLYRPVLDVIARRREGIERQLADARSLRDEAEESKARYENRLADWDDERRKALEELNREIEAERARRLREVVAGVAAEQEKNRVLEQRRQAETAALLEEQALDNAARFAAALLQRLSGPELERRLVDLVLERLPTLSRDKLDKLRSSYGVAQSAVVVSSAYPLEQAKQESLRGILAQLSLGNGEYRFEERPELLAGLCITVGSWRLGLNLRDELQGFVQAGIAT